MPKVIVDNTLGKKLDGLDAPVELSDPSGRLLGHFVPLRASRPRQVPAHGCPYSDAELAQMQDETGGRALPEIWKTLGRA